MILSSQLTIQVYIKTSSKISTVGQIKLTDTPVARILLNITKNLWKTSKLTKCLKYMNKTNLVIIELLALEDFPSFAARNL